ncbi:Uncharacterised protein [Vibrio cholerae]|nr:Uncharacterised protein [Vibrio cholerae]CSI30452.1 Uncharacterised protein [Vibrio cholerae]CSI45887.1 Uncharacterised protein [Vibrio cholerae]
MPAPVLSSSRLIRTILASGVAEPTMPYCNERSRLTR